MKSSKSIHFVGIGGIGMSALARYFKSQKWAVSGSDGMSSKVTQELKKDAINVRIGHKKANLPQNSLLVVRSQAIPLENPEIREAARLGIKVLTYPEVIGEITRNHKTIAIAGSHGKSTTTSLAALALIRAKYDPTVIVGTLLREFGGRNFRRGMSDYLVLEADEYGRAFLHYSPFVAIVTNIDREHLDTYKNLSGVKKSFFHFLANVREGGAFILNRDDKNLSSLKNAIEKLAKKKRITVIWYSLKSTARKKVEREIQIFGEHNISNALAVFELGKFLKIPERATLQTIHEYRGAWRRMEYRGELVLQKQKTKISVFDDYGHHPTEIKATLSAFRKAFPKQILVCVFEPHQAKRLAALFPEFINAFTDAHFAFILPIYKVAGRDKIIQSKDSEALVRAIEKRHPSEAIFYLENPKHLKRALETLFSSLNERFTIPDPILLMMGAGNINLITDTLL